MAFVVKNTTDNTVIHKNSVSDEDLHKTQMPDDWVVMKNEYGEMKTKQTIFDGIRMVYSDWILARPLTLDWKGDMDVVTMYFSLKGELSIGSNASNTFALGTNQQNMFYATEASGMMKIDDLRFKSFIVQFDKEAFLRIAGDATESLKYFADHVANKKSASFSKAALPVDVNTQTAIDAMLNCKFADPLKRVFLLSKAMELLVIQADLDTRGSTQKSSHVKTDYDRDRIYFAREYMLKRIETPPTIPELAKIAGINEFKLKKGYKEIFGSTIFGHLAEARLQLSKDALKEGRKSIAEIASDLGYSSVQHFSSTFKKRFGNSPLREKGKSL